MSLASTAPGLLSQTLGYQRAAMVFGEDGTVDAYLRFESALAEAEAKNGKGRGGVEGRICDHGIEFRSLSIRQ